MSYVFNDAPQRVYWELTRACDLACTHCRANANPCRHPEELSTQEIFDTLDALARDAKPHVILTGGDPLKRADFFAIVDHTVELGLPCLVAPSATPLLDHGTIRGLADRKVTAMSLSLDGSTADRHDAVRGISGTFDRTVDCAREIVASGISLQINTLVTEGTRDDLPAIYRRVQEIGADRWSLFFLINTGRGQTLKQITPEQADEILNWTLDLAGNRKPLVTTTEAPHYRRLAVMRHASRIEHTPPNPTARHSLGIRDGNGVMFISHTGDVQPSGFLPLTAGNVRDEDPLQIYRNSPLFTSLRRTELFEGRCGTCEFREICGGSRARAYGTTGNPLQSDPLCSYQPHEGTPSRRPH